MIETGSKLLPGATNKEEEMARTKITEWIGRCGLVKIGGGVQIQMTFPNKVFDLVFAVLSTIIIGILVSDSRLIPTMSSQLM
jgi:hypothetical protein